MRIARRLHPIAGSVALLIIATFWLTTTLSELFGSSTIITTVKTSIPWGFLLLVPALLVTGGSGVFLAQGQRGGPAGRKLKRMPFIAANGLLVLVPAALFLAHKAATGQFDVAFYSVQALELAAGALNIVLLGLSLRDGLAMTRWRRGRSPHAAAVFATQVINRRLINQGTLSVRLQKPDDFTFSAGQAVYLTLSGMSVHGGLGRVRTFSIASAPDDGYLEIATRFTDSAYKHYLARAAAGTPVQLEGPYGQMTLHEDAGRTAVFVAGGIGITPFRSMLRDALHRRLPHRVFLFYCNRTQDDAAYLDELQQLSRRHPHFTLVPVFTTGKAISARDVAHYGELNVDLIAHQVGDLAEPVFYLAGPPSMVSSTHASLLQAGVVPRQLRAEAFPGYGRR